MAVNKMRKRASDYGIAFGMLPRGKYNAITDVPGVKVGHCTIMKDRLVRTGVTAIIPAEGNLYSAPIFAATQTINGFGKSIGFLQIEELGQLETPILLTNTLNVGLAADALVEYTLQANPAATTVNPVVAECNDGRLNEIRTRSVNRAEVFQALREARSGRIESGSVGAGTGMVCYGFKGGIGTASRRLTLDGRAHTLGVLVLSNFGTREELTIQGRRIEAILADGQPPESEEAGGEGSIIVVMGTDIPLTHRQLKRLARRAGFGIARTGGRCAHHSGELVITFSNANRMPKEKGKDIGHIRLIQERGDLLQDLFAAVIDGVEEAIIDSLFTAETVRGKGGRIVQALPVEKIIIR